MQNVQFLDAVGLAPERAPIEAAPVPILQVEKNRQDEKHNDAGQNAFLIHVGMNLHRHQYCGDVKPTQLSQGKRPSGQGQTYVSCECGAYSCFS
jgi:hypothetical protein